MATQLQKLMFSIDLLDRVTGPAGRIQKTLGGVADTADTAFERIAVGAGGIAASGYAIKAMTGPAQEFNMAIGEVRSLDVAQDSLDKLSNKAVEFSIKYGESAKDFVSSSYDIQSSIAGLSGEELASFTNASNILAKGTKADSGTITNYMGTMYGIFKNSADEMGKAQWVEQLTGQTATAVQMFKTNGMEMSAAFGSLGADATSAGIEAAEQMAVLGKLQSTMSGSEAGTKYRAFLAGVGKAQKKLGLRFTDSNGQMLGMVEILDKIKGKFGDTLDVAESDALSEAFGSSEASGLLKLLLADTQGLQENIAALGQVTGMEKAETMAKSMVDPFQQWDAGVQAVKIGLGQALLPLVLPTVEAMAEGAGAIYNWTQEYPTLAKWIGVTVVGITGLMGAVTAFAAVGSMAGMVTRFYTAETKGATFWTKLFGKQSFIAKGATLGWSFALKAASFTMGGFRKILGLGKIAMIAMNAAMYANPVGLVVGGIVALIAGVAAVIYYWDDLKAAFMDSSWGQAIMGWFDKILGMFKSLSGVWDWFSEKLGFSDEMEVDPGQGVLKTSPSLEAPRAGRNITGNAGKSVANAVTNNTRSESKSIQIGQITTARPINAQEMTNMAMMAGA